MRRLRQRTSMSRRMTIIAGVTVLILIVGSGTVLADPGGWFGANDNAWPYNASGPSPVLAAVGDISCQPGSPAEAEKPTDTYDQGIGSTARDAAQNATAQQVEAMQPNRVRPGSSAPPATAGTRTTSATGI